MRLQHEGCSGFVVIAFVIAAAGATVILRVLRLPGTWEAWGVALLAGYCLQSVVALCIGSFSIVLAEFVLLLLALLVAIYCFAKKRGEFFADLSANRVGNHGPFDYVSSVSVVLALGCGLISAHAPVTSWDAGVAHLALPASYWRDGRIAATPLNNYSAYPQLVHVLFSTLASHNREAIAAGITWSFGVLLCINAYWLARRIGGAQCAYPAAAIVATTPLFLEQSSIPGIDVPYTATVIGALCALAAWNRERHRGWLVLAGILAGSGCGIRHTAYLANTMLLVGVFIVAQNRRRRSCAVFAVTMLACAAPWLIRSAMVSGNPVYPFFSSVLGANAAPDVDVAAIAAHSSIQGNGVLQLVAFPWSLTMNPARYGGWSTSPGVLWLVLGVIGVIVGGRGAWLLGAFGGVGLAAIFFFQRFARYAFPFLAPLMIIASVPIEKLPALRRVIGAALVVSYILGLAPCLAGVVTKFPAVIRIQSRDAYLTERIERYPAMRWVARELPKDGTILSLDPRGYYFDRAAHTNFEALKAIASRNPDAQRQWLRENGIDYLFYPNKYVDESPAFRETGVGAMLDAWRADPAHFVLTKEFELPNPRDGGTERVEIYEFRP